MLLLTGVVYAESLDEIVSQEVREDFKVNQEAEVIIYFNKLPEEVSFDQKVGSDESRKRTKQEIFDEYTSIKEKRKASQDDFVLESKSLGVEIKQISYSGRWVRAVISERSLEKLVSHPRILRIDYPKKLSAFLGTSTEIIGADKVRKIEEDNVPLEGDGQTVCVIDTGVNKNHNDLNGKVLAEQCFCSIGVPGGCCPNGQATQSGNGAAADDGGHGTAVAGIIAANGKIKGVAPKSKIVAIKVLDSTGSGTDPDLDSAIEWCISNSQEYEISVISMSLGGGLHPSEDSCFLASPAIAEAIGDAHALRISVVAGSGNAGSTIGIASPACLPRVISVGATYNSKTNPNKLWDGTNRNFLLDVLAPGQTVRSTSVSGGYGIISETSAATPHVSGAIALLKQRNPYLDPNEIEDILEETGIDVRDDKPFFAKTYPRIDALKAIKNTKSAAKVTIESCGNTTLVIFNTVAPSTKVLDPQTSYTLEPGESVNVTVDVLASLMAFDNYNAEVNILSNAFNNATITIPFAIAKFDGQGLLEENEGVILASQNQQSGAEGIYQAQLFIDENNTADNLEFLFNLLTDDTVNYNVTLPNGTNVIGSSVASNPASLTFENPIDGTWTTTLSTTAALTEDLNFQIETTPFPSDNPVTGINFSDVRVGYVDTCLVPDTAGLRIAMRGTENNTAPINTTNATGMASNAFLTALVIPNSKLTVNLPPNEVIVDETFAQTQLADVLLTADVALKKENAAEFESVLEQACNNWTAAINQTTYYPKIKNAFHCPSFSARRTMVISNATLNGTECDAYLSDVQLKILETVDDAWVDYSSFGLTENETDDANSKLPAWKSTLQNLFDTVDVPVLNTKANTNATYTDLRRVSASLAMAHWYKQLPRENLLLADLIDSENITAVGVNRTFNESYWVTQSYQKLFTTDLNLTSGNFTFDFYGGVAFDNVTITTIGNISFDVQDAVGDAITRTPQNLSNTHYYSSLLASDLPDLTPLSLYFNTSIPLINNSINITVVIKNNGDSTATNFKVQFYSEYFYASGDIGLVTLGEQTITSLGPGATTTASIIANFSFAGEHDISAEVDSENAVTESNELNNVRTETIDVVTPFPTTTITSPADNTGFFAYQPVPLTGSATDPQDGTLNGASLAWRSDIGGNLGTGTNLSVSLGIGYHTITLTATDSEGNADNDTIRIPVTPSAPPTASIISPTAGQHIIFGTPASFEGSGLDPEDGVLAGSALQWNSSIDGAIGEGSAFTLNNLSIGNHTITLMVRDNTSINASARVNVSIDPGTPSVTITSPSENQFFHNAVAELAANATDPAEGDLSARIEWMSNRAGALGTGSRLNVTLSEGTHLVTAFVQNRFGISKIDEILLTFLPPLPPVITILEPAQNQTITRAAALSLNAYVFDPEDINLSNNSVYWFSSINGLLGNGSQVTLNSSNVSVGNHLMTLSATDRDNLTTNATVNITIASAPPVITINRPAAGAIFAQGSAINFSVGATDFEDGTLPNSSINWTSSLGGQLGHGDVTALSNLSTGTHILTVTAQDSHGVVTRKQVGIVVVGIGNITLTVLSDGSPARNLSYAAGILQVDGISVTYSIFDTFRPRLNATAVPTQPQPGQQINITANATDNVNVTAVNATLDGIRTALTFNATTNLYRGNLTAPGPGTYILNVTAVDFAGLTNTTSLPITVSTTNAELIVTEINVSPSSPNELEFNTFTATVGNFGGANALDFLVEFLVDGDSLQNKTLNATANNQSTISFFWIGPYGNHTVTIKADAANSISEFNESNNARNITVFIADRSPPVIEDITTTIVKQGDPLQITANVTDNANVSSVTARINGTTVSLLLNTTSGLFEGSTTAVAAGTQVLQVTAIDINNLIATQRETATVFPTTADLSIGFEDVDISHLPIATNTTISFFITVHNDGGTTISSAKVELLIDGTSVRNNTLNLPALGSNLTEFRWNASFGSHTLTVKVDPDNTVSESNESNNQLTRNVTVVDLTPPTIHAIIVPPAMYENASFVIKANVTDNLNVSAVNATINTSQAALAFNSTTGLFEGALITPAAGTYPLRITAVDASNITSVRELLVTIYPIAAELTLTTTDVVLIPNNVSEGGNLTLNVTIHNNGGTDANNFVVQLLVDGVVRNSTNASAARAADSTVQLNWTAVYHFHNLTVRLDATGAITESNETNNELNRTLFVPDTTAPPAPNVSATPANWTTQTTHNISWTAVSDTNGIASYEYQIDSNPFVSNGLSLSFTTTPQAEGIHTIFVRAVDGTGNTGALGSVSIYIDRTAPNIPFVREWHAGSNWTTHTTPFYSWNDPGDVGSGVTAYFGLLDGQLIPLNSSLSYHANLTSSGNHTFRVHAQDALQQNSSFSNTVTVLIDIDAPGSPTVSSSTHPSSSRWYSLNTPIFNLSATDAHSGVAGFYYVVDRNESTVPTTMNLFTTNNTLNISSMGGSTAGNATGLANGAWYLHAIATDNVANRGNASHFLFSIDTAAPAIIDHAPLNSTNTDNRTPTLRVNYVDVYAGINTSTITLVFDGIDITANATINENRTTFAPQNPLSSATHAAVLRVTDLAGNQRILNWTFGVAANESEARNAIELGINSSLANYTLYTDQQLYVRYLDAVQNRGRFDKVVARNNQTWAFNYVTPGESFTSILTLYNNTLVVWENQTLTPDQIRSQVESRINKTRW